MLIKNVIHSRRKLRCHRCLNCVTFTFKKILQNKGCYIIYFHFHKSTLLIFMNCRRAQPDMHFFKKRWFACVCISKHVSGGGIYLSTVVFCLSQVTRAPGNLREVLLVCYPVLILLSLILHYFWFELHFAGL